MMAEDFDPQSLFAMAELNQLRTQALDLFDRCLAENNPAPIIAFIERHITDDPYHMLLLRDFSDGLHQRLLSLRANHYDLRNNVVQAFMAYGVDIAPLLPPNALDKYHLMNQAQVLDYAVQHGYTGTPEELIMLGKLLEASVKTAARLQAQIRLISDLQAMASDWLAALYNTLGRRFWSDSPPSTPIH
jgi:hypothetical protein